MIPAKDLAGRVVQSIKTNGWDVLPFQQAADNLERLYANMPEKMKAYVEEVEVLLIQNRVDVQEEAQEQLSTPLSPQIHRKPVTA